MSENNEPDRESSGDEPADDPRRRIDSEITALHSMLKKSLRQLRAPLLFEGFVWALVSLGAVAVTAQVAGLLAGDVGPLVARWIGLAGSAAVALGMLVALFEFWRSQPTLEGVARTLQRHAPQFRNDIIAALQFGAALQSAQTDHGWSPRLAFAHLERTNRKLLAVLDEQGSLAHLVPQRSTTPALLALGGAAVVLCLPLLLTPDATRALWRDALFPSLEESAEEVAHRPVVGELDILFSFPPYADMPPRFEPFTTGHIETLVGTEVTLETYPLIAAAESFEIVVENDEGSRVIPMESDGHRLEASMLVTKPGTYSFRAVMPDGAVVRDGIDRTISVQPDEVPAVTITSHPEQVEVSPDEILEIEFDVSDDFGVESVARAWAFGNDDPTIRPLDLPELSAVPRGVQSTFAFDLTPLSLQPKDRVTLWIEATDNNSLTGPGIGRSTPIVLRVTSPEDRHMKVIAAEAEVLEALLGILADFLENPAGEREPDSKGIYRQIVPDDLPLETVGARFAALSNIHASQTEVLTTMSQVVERMKEDPLMSKRDVVLFEGLYEQLYALNRDGADILNRHRSSARSGTLLVEEFQKVADWTAKSEDSLEKGLVRLEDLLARQRMDAVRATAEDIRELKERLKELLEKYKETQDPELKEAILREVQRLRQRMQELMARMQAQLKQLPQQHVNMEALEQQQLESDAAQMTDNLQRIEDLIEKGDIDGALEALDAMTENLDAMTEGMDEGFEAAESEGMREMDRALSELMDKANDLEARQRDVERRTSEVQEALDEREREEIESMLRERTRELSQLVERQKRRLDRVAQRDLAPHDQDAAQDAAKRVGELQEMLDNLDIEQALQRARESSEDLRALEFSMDLSQRYTDERTSRGRAVRETAHDLRSASPASRQIVRQLEEIMDQARSRPGQQSHPQLQQLAREQADVEEQAQSLRRDVEETSQRFPMLEQQLAPPLDAAGGQMGEARQQLEQSNPQRGLDHQRSALESLRELKQSMRDALQQQKQGGKEGQGRTSRKERVTIPEKDGRTKQQFRQEIMDGMKDERLESYESEIERYYRSLME